MDGFVPFPPEYAERYRREGYWRDDVLGEVLPEWAIREGRVALVCGPQRITYAQLDNRADRLAAGLHRLGIRRDDRIVVQLPNVPDFVSLALALFRIGAVPVFALPSHRSSEIIHLCEYSGASAYVVPDSFQGFDYIGLATEVRAKVEGLAHVIVSGSPGPHIALQDIDSEPKQFSRPDPCAPAFLLLSGGTVGLPKLIPRTHNDYACQLRVAAQRMCVSRDTVYLAVLPVAHNAALGCPGLLGTLRVGGTVVLASSPSPADVFRLIERERVTLTTLISPLVSLWIDAAEQFGKRFPQLVLEVGGAMLEPALARRTLTSLGCTLSHWFGMAEGAHCCTEPGASEEIVVHTQGRPLCPADELRIVDELENDVTPGSIGELLVRGPCTLRGYYRAPEHNQMAFTSQGYLRTGDLARLTGEGNLVVEGRIKNVINRGGEKISVEELETHLQAHPTIRKAAVVAMRDPELGERTCAFVIAPNVDITLSQVKDFLRQRGVAQYKFPDRLDIVAALPQTGLGKIDRSALRRMAEAVQPVLAGGQ